MFFYIDFAVMLPKVPDIVGGLRSPAPVRVVDRQHDGVLPRLIVCPAIAPGGSKTDGSDGRKAIAGLTIAACLGLALLFCFFFYGGAQGAR